MLAAATSFFARTNISQSYTTTGSRASTPGPHGSNGPQTPSASLTPSMNIGLWRVQSASHKVTNKRVSVWTFDKRGPDMERMGPLAKERALEVLKAEASALGRLRHPCILEMVEPLEETRGELTFATEPVLSSLELSIPGAGRRSPLVELDEIEIQKGILQICKGLSFLHSSAQLIHTNISPESIIINNSGDWKISGLGLTIPLLQPNGSATRWEFPTFDGRAPSYIQRSFDYMAPEYALDETLVTSSDMYSLGCLIYAVHCKGSVPFKTHGSLGGLRDSAGKNVPGLEGLDSDLQSLLRSMITRLPAPRPTPSTLPSHPFFSSLPISTLNFLDRSNFTSKTREEKVGFMKGLTGVLGRFSEGLRTRKILPSLLEEMKDTNLLPYILPNVFSIANDLTPSQFASMVLPSLKPLFAVKEPPQNMLTLLDNLSMLQGKTEKGVFRGEVLPLVYNALESEHAVVTERALKAVPDLCETIDYAEVQGVLFPRVALVFTKTRILTVKVATLNAFLTMVKTLDQSSLTQKLVPLLSKIRTKEPAVMMATLSVQEAMGSKVDREAVATLVLPQLWAMSMGPLLNVDQFSRFMSVIRKLGDRVEKEHNQFLRDSQRLEDRSSTAVGATTGGIGGMNGGVDFASLVASGSGAGGRPNGDSVGAANTGETSWDDDVWGSIFSDNTSSSPTPVVQPLQVTRPNVVQSMPSSPRQLSHDNVHPGPSRLGPRQAPPTTTSYNSRTFPSPPSQRPSFSATTTTTSVSSLHTNNTGSYTSPSSYSASPPPLKPNYNISLVPSAPTAPPITTLTPQGPNYNFSTQPTVSFNSPPMAAMGVANSAPMGLGMGSMLAPSKPAQPSWGTSSKAPSKDDWGDFDPLA